MVDQASLEKYEGLLEVLWLFVTGLYVFFMQIGHGMVEVGSSHRKNSKTVVVKNICTFALTATIFWLFGYGLGYGCKNGDCRPGIGDDDFALRHFSAKSQLLAPNKRSPSGYLTWYFRFAFASMCSTAVSGGIAERCQFVCSLICGVFVAGFVHPVAAHWVWGNGWLQRGGVIDTAGSGVVSVLGGVVGIVGAVVLRPRVGRFEGRLFHVKTTKTQPFSPVFHALGILLLWTGWYGLNAGSSSVLVGRARYPSEIVAINTALAPSASTLSVMLVSWLWSGRQELPCAITFNGVLAGLVAISASCAVVSPAIAFVIGAISGLVYFLAAGLLRQLKIDDPLDLSCIHLACGFWGLIAVGLFATKHRVEKIFSDTNHGNHYGLFDGGGGRLLGWQVLYGGVLILWGMMMGLAMFGLCYKLGIGRVSKEAELYGLDASYYGSPTKHEHKLHEMMAVLGNQAQSSHNNNNHNNISHHTTHGNVGNMAPHQNPSEASRFMSAFEMNNSTLQREGTHADLAFLEMGVLSQQSNQHLHNQDDRSCTTTTTSLATS